MLFYLMCLITNSFALDINVEMYQTDKKWKETPDIIICNNSPVTKKQVQDAVDAWKEKGIKLGNVRYQKYGECGKNYSNYDYGKILIAGKLRFLNKDQYNGWTVRYTPTDDVKEIDIRSAICEINDETVHNNPDYVHKLLIHEIGHALGYAHQKHSKNDVMSDNLYLVD